MINNSSFSEVSHVSDCEHTLISYSENSIETNASGSIYTNYADLVDVYQSHGNIGLALEKLVGMNINSKADWKVQFQLLEHLRILNKYHYAELNPKLFGFTDFIIQCIESIRSNLIKEALLLLQELFPNARMVPLPDEFIGKIVPVLCEKAVSDKGFIKIEARKAVKELELWCAGDASIIALAAKSSDKNAAICEFAFQTLCQSVKNLGDELHYKLTLGGCKVLFRAVLKALEGKRAVMKKQSEEIWLRLKTLLQKECTIESFLEDKIGLTREEVHLLMQVKSEKKTAAKMNLQSFIKEQKMLIEKDANIDKIQEEAPLKSVGPSLILKSGSTQAANFSPSKENLTK